MALRESSDVIDLCPPGPAQRPATAITRRTALARGVAAAGLLGGGAAIAACTTSSSPDEATRTARQLVPLARAAGEDAVAARALAAQTPDRAAALRVIADEREVHLRAVTDEISRLNGDLVPSASPAPSAAPAGSTPAESAPAGSTPVGAPVVTTVDGLRGRLAGARTATATLAVSSDGYRAGLLGSIASSLATLVEVQLG